VKRVSAGSRSPTDPEALSEIVRTLFPSGSVKESTLCETGPTWEIEVITETEVAEAGRSLQNNKSQGPDAVPNKAMKLALGTLPSTFAALYNACLREGTFPRRWKVQKLLLLNKPGKPPGEASSYRPICLLDTVGKVFEKLISKRLNLAIDAAGGLSPPHAEASHAANVHVTGFADDVAITIVAKTTAEVEYMANTAVRKVESWLSLAGLQLSAHKTEVVLISSWQLVETAKLTVGGVDVVSQRAVKYLGVMIDTRLSFKEHLE
ncbi:hypothetical protein KR084_010301, partial [Drosophila pseudotakahashii]